MLLLFLIVNLFAWPTTIKKNTSQKKNKEKLFQDTPTSPANTSTILCLNLQFNFNIYGYEIYDMTYDTICFTSIYVCPSVRSFVCLFIYIIACLYDGDAFAYNIDKLFVIVLHVQNMFSSIFYNYFLIKKLYRKKTNPKYYVYTYIKSKRVFFPHLQRSYFIGCLCPLLISIHETEREW